MYFTSGSDRAFEQLMQTRPGADHFDNGEAGSLEDCGTCRFYRPHWKYQFCVYEECPYQPGKLTALDGAVKFQVKGVDDEMAVFRVEKNRGYDEYRFDLDEIKHDPYVLTSILSALHNGVFTLGEVQGDLAMLFEKQYILTQTIETETRYRTETRTDSEGNTYTVEVPYPYYICNVKLENFDLSHLPIYILTEEQMGFYAAYMQTLGNRPDLFPNGSYEQEAIRRGATLCMDKMKGLLLQDKLVEYAYRQLSDEKAPTFHKLLFVHAEDTSAEVLRAAMLQKGFDLILVSSIGEAKRRIFEDKEIDLILCDLELPDGTAMELFHTPRRVAGMFQMKNPPVRLLPFFILTENNDLATEYEYRHEGVNDYITAPQAISRS